MTFWQMWIIVGICLLKCALSDIAIQQDCSKTKLSYYDQSDNKCLHCKICNDDAHRDGGEDCNLGIYRCKKSHSFLPVCPAVRTSSGEICSVEVAEKCTVVCADGSEATLKCTVVNHNSRKTTHVVVSGNLNCSWIFYKDEIKNNNKINRSFKEKSEKNSIFTSINKTAKPVIKGKKCVMTSTAKDIIVIVICCIIGAVSLAGIIVCIISYHQNWKHKLPADKVLKISSRKSLETLRGNDEDLRELEPIVIDGPPVNHTINLQEEREHQSAQEDWFIPDIPQYERQS